MSGIKKLAGQTFWYGLSSIGARFLNYLLTPYLTYKLSGEAFGEMSLVYAIIPFLNVIFTYGLETTFFRYMQREEYKSDIYNTAMVSIICSTLFLTAGLMLLNQQVASLISIKQHPEYITWSALIIAFDTLSALPFAKLRQEGRPIKFAAIRIIGILIYIGFTFFFLSICPKLKAANPNSIWLIIYNEDLKVGYIILANLVQAVVTFLLLSKEFFSFKWQFNSKLWKEFMIYSLPLIIAGFGGMVNETFDRIMLGWLSTSKDPLFEVGTYSACYKLSLLISLFIQAFRMGAEPFFFAHSESGNPQKVYARVMKFFVLTICVMFLVVTLFLGVWKSFIQNPKMWVGLKVVPILLLANMFLGIYYNLSIWYKITNKTMAGAYITIIGAIITLIINYFFIPKYGYMACAWATFFCYGTMMVLCYFWGQREYRVPYAAKKLIAYIVLVVVLYFLQKLLLHFWDSQWVNYFSGILILSIFVLFVLKVEKKEFQKLPVVGKYLL